MEWLQQILNRLTEAFKWYFILNPWEQALRVRCGKWVRKYEGGLHFRLPYLDTVFIKSVRYRVSDMGNQTITTVDDKTITLTSSLGYRVVDVEPLYQKLHMADESLMLMVQGAIAEYIEDRIAASCRPSGVNDYINATLDFSVYGLGDVNFKVIDFAVVRTYRLINEGFYNYSEHKLSTDNPE